MASRPEAVHPPHPAVPHGEVAGEALAKRLNRIEGQIRGIARMIEEDRYCVDILDLSLSIQRALRSLDGLVIEGHLRTHVIEMMTGGEQEKAISELLRLYRVQGPGEAAVTTKGNNHHG